MKQKASRCQRKSKTWIPLIATFNPWSFIHLAISHFQRALADWHISRHRAAILWYRKYTVMWLTWASHFLWLNLTHPRGLSVSHGPKRAGNIGCNCNYSVGCRIKPDLSRYKHKKKTILSYSAAMIVMTQSPHMVVVILHLYDTEARKCNSSFSSSVFALCHILMFQIKIFWL